MGLGAAAPNSQKSEMAVRVFSCRVISLGEGQIFHSLGFKVQGFRV